MLRRYEKWIDRAIRNPHLNFFLRILTLAPVILPLAIVEVYVERPWGYPIKPAQPPVEEASPQLSGGQS